MTANITSKSAFTSLSKRHVRPTCAPRLSPAIPHLTPHLPLLPSPSQVGTLGITFESLASESLDLNLAFVNASKAFSADKVAISLSQPAGTPMCLSVIG